MPDKPGKTSRRKAQAVNLDSIGLEMGNKPPQALEVEEAVLGAMLIEPTSVDMALEELTPSCFYDPRHKMIFEAMSELVNEHTSVDIVTVSSKLRERGNLEAVGGPVVLAGLSEKVGAAAHIEYYVKILKQKSIQRDLITASYEILRDSYDDSVKVDDLIDEAQSKVYNAIQNNLKKDVQEVGSIINDAMREVRLAVLEADVNYKVVKEFVNSVTERAVGSEVLESLVPSQQIVKIVNAELVEIRIRTMESVSMQLSRLSQTPFQSRPL